MMLTKSIGIVSGFLALGLFMSTDANAWKKKHGGGYGHHGKYIVVDRCKGYHARHDPWCGPYRCVINYRPVYEYRTCRWVHRQALHGHNGWYFAKGRHYAAYARAKHYGGHGSGYGYGAHGSAVYGGYHGGSYGHHRAHGSVVYGGIHGGYAHHGRKSRYRRRHHYGPAYGHGYRKPHISGGVSVHW